MYGVSPQPAQALAQRLHPHPLRGDTRLARLIGGPELGNEILTDHGTQAAEQLVGVFGVLVAGEPHAESELGVVLEERVGPCRPAPLGVHGPRRRR